MSHTARVGCWFFSCSADQVLLISLHRPSMLCSTKNVFFLLCPARFLTLIIHVREGNLSLSSRSESHSSGSETSNPSPFLSPLVKICWLFTHSLSPELLPWLPFASPECDSCELSQELSHTGAQSFGVLLLNLVFPAGNPSAARCLSFLPYSRDNRTNAALAFGKDLLPSIIWPF